MKKKINIHQYTLQKRFTGSIHLVSERPIGAKSKKNLDRNVVV